MSGSRVVDMDRWRARARVRRTTGPGGDGVLAVRGSAVAAGPAATVLVLPDTEDARDAGRPVASGPSSVFGPVVAFGLLPRAVTTPTAVPVPGVAAATAVAAQGEDAPGSTTRRRAPRARHLVDARGATRGPRR